MATQTSASQSAPASGIAPSMQSALASGAPASGASIPSSSTAGTPTATTPTATTPTATTPTATTPTATTPAPSVSIPNPPSRASARFKAFKKFCSTNRANLALAVVTLGFAIADLVSQQNSLANGAKANVISGKALRVSMWDDCQDRVSIRNSSVCLEIENPFQTAPGPGSKFGANPTAGIGTPSLHIVKRGRSADLYESRTPSAWSVLSGSWDSVSQLLGRTKYKSSNSRSLAYWIFVLGFFVLRLCLVSVYMLSWVLISLVHKSRSSQPSSFIIEEATGSRESNIANTFNSIAQAFGFPLIVIVEAVEIFVILGSIQVFGYLPFVCAAVSVCMIQLNDIAGVRSSYDRIPDEEAQGHQKRRERAMAVTETIIRVVVSLDSKLGSMIRTWRKKDASGGRLTRKTQ